MITPSDRSDQRRAPSRWLLLRGLARQGRHWFEFPERLAVSLSVRAVAADLPGTGQRRAEAARWSVARIAESLAYALGGPPEEPWGVLGMSLGGMVALSLAEQLPRQVSRVVLLNTSSRPAACQRRLQPPALAQLVRAARILEPERRERSIYALTTNAAPHEVAGWAARAASIASESPPSPGVIAAQLWAAARFRARPVRQPVLVLSARCDRVVSASCSAALARDLNAPHRCHPTAGHDLALEDPGWVIEQMRAWLRAAEPVSHD